MSADYEYTAGALWTGPHRGVATAKRADLSIDFAAPPEFQGEPGHWTPEAFLIAAVAACFVTTFQAIADLSKFPFAALDVSSTGTVEKGEHGFQFTRVVVKPVLQIAQEADRERALRLLEKTEHSCLVSRSLRSEIVLEPAVNVSATS